MPTILINTSVSQSNLNNEKLTQSLDQDFRNDLNELITKLLSKTNLINSFSIKYDMDDLIPINQANSSPNNNNNNNKCICLKMSKLFKSLLNENQDQDSNSNNNNNITNDVNNLFKEIELIKANQTVMANKLDLIINKLNNNSTSNANSCQESAVTNVQLIGAKKRKFQTNNNLNANYMINNNINSVASFINEENDSHSSNHDDESSNSKRNNDTNLNNTETIVCDIEENNIKNENIDENDIYVLNNNNSNSNNSRALQSQVNKVNNIITKNTSGSQNNNSNNNGISLQYNDIDFLNLLNEDHIQKYLQLDSYVNFKPPIYQNNNLFYIDDHLAAAQYKNSKSRRNFAARLTRYVFTPKERLESNCNGRGKKQFDQFRLEVMRNTIFKYYPCKQATVVVNGDTISTGDGDENLVWFRDCMPAIDESNRVLKKQVIAWHKKYLASKMSSSANLNNSNNNINGMNSANLTISGLASSMHSMLNAVAASNSYLNSFNNNNNNNNSNNNNNNNNVQNNNLNNSDNNDNDYYQFDYEDEFDEF